MLHAESIWVTDQLFDNQEEHDGHMENGDDDDTADEGYEADVDRPKIPSILTDDDGKSIFRFFSTSIIE